VRVGTEAPEDAVLDGTYTDGVVVVHRGRVMLERYAGETDARTPHLLMSVSKSIVGCVVANLVERGALALDRPVTDHVPELGASGYRGARLRDLLDMRSGIRFSEAYTDLDAEVRVLEQAVLWRPRTRDDVPDSMYAFLATLEAARGTAASSSTARARPTCSAGSASGPQAGAWPTSSASCSGSRWAPSTTPR